MMRKLILLVSMFGLSSTALSTEMVAKSEATVEPANTAQQMNYHFGVATHFVRKMRSMAHWDPERYIPEIAAMNVGWIRDEIMWDKVEKEKGVYSIPKEDLEWINIANKYGIKVIITFNGNNPNIYSNNQFPPDAYSNAIAYVAQQLQGKIDAIEVLNEPFNWYANSFGQGTRNAGTIYGTAKDGTIESWMRNYVQLLNESADKIKARTTGIKVIGLGGFPAMNWRMIRYGISKNVDGITLHPYSYATTPEIMPYPDSKASFKNNGNTLISDKDGSFSALIDRMLNFSIENGGPKSIWLTEWGWTTKKNLPISRGNFVGVSEDEQAVYIQRRFMESLGVGIKTSIVYSFMDDKNDTGIASQVNSEDNFGLLRSDGTPKPSYYAVQRLASLSVNLLPTNDVSYIIQQESARPDDSPVKAFDGTLLYAPDRVMSYQFKNEKNNTRYIAAWSMEKYSQKPPRLSNITLPASVKGIVVTNMLTGTKVKFNVTTVDNHKIVHNVPIPVNPVLIELQE
ncbi:hypothetical protein [Serratia sp. BFP-2025]|uniref:hypothetical protein n=1 Tax=Serratia sp. BFP-2025 TaxID=3433707 RepID=UPI003D7C5761